VSGPILERPRLLVVAGPNGAGKTTVTERGLSHEWFGGCEYVNPDFIARDLGDWNDPATVLRAAQIAAEQREACLRDGRSLAFETVFSAPDKVDFVRRAITAGFFVRLLFVGTDAPQINVARVVRRMLQGGHEVPIRKILDRWSRSIASCAVVADEVDREAQFVLRATEGRVARLYHPPRPWMEPIVAGLVPAPA
jgi:predicted ABC-type ATPase